MKMIIAGLLLIGATTAAVAQSQPNFGPNGPSRSDCFGEPYSGAVASRCGFHHGWHHHYAHYR